jgi:hypothetical protein
MPTTAPGKAAKLRVGSLISAQVTLNANAESGAIAASFA